MRDEMTFILYNADEEGITLKHFGTPKMRWGVQNGPPYPLSAGKRLANGLLVPFSKKARESAQFDKAALKAKAYEKKQKKEADKEVSKISKDNDKILDNYKKIGTSVPNKESEFQKNLKSKVEKEKKEAEEAAKAKKEQDDREAEDKRHSDAMAEKEKADAKYDNKKSEKTKEQIEADEIMAELKKTVYDPSKIVTRADEQSFNERIKTGNFEKLTSGESLLYKQYRANLGLDKKETGEDKINKKIASGEKIDRSKLSTDEASAYVTYLENQNKIKAAKSNTNNLLNVAKTGMTVSETAKKISDRKTDIEYDKKQNKSQKKAYKKAKKAMSTMTDEELSAKINRMNLENQYYQSLNNQRNQTRVGRTYVQSKLEKAGNKVAVMSSAAALISSLKDILD